MNSSNIFQISAPFLWEIIKLLFFPLLVLIIANYYKNNKRGNEWLGFLVYKNIKIYQCMDNFEKIKSSFRGFGIVRAISSSLLGLGLTVYIFDHYYFDQNNIFISVFKLGVIIDQIILVIIVFIGTYVIYIRKKNKSLEKSNLIESYFQIVIYFFYGSSFIILVLILILIFLVQNWISNIVTFFLGLIGLVLGFILVIVIKTYFRNIFLNDLKYELNSKYFKDFPFVNISTIAGNVYGKIDTIFNDKLITLDNEGTKIAIEWEKIIFIELFKPP